MSRLAKFSIWLERPRFLVAKFCLFIKICNPTVPCTRVRKLISKWATPTGIVKTPSSTCWLWFHLISYVLLAIIIAREVTGNPLSDLDDHGWHNDLTHKMCPQSRSSVHSRVKYIWTCKCGNCPSEMDVKHKNQLVNQRLVHPTV